MDGDGVRGPILALWLAPSAEGPGAREFLRVVAALVALDRPLWLVEAGPGRGVLGAEEAPADVERTLETLRAVGVVPQEAGAAEVEDLLGSCSCVLRFADPARRGLPALLEIGDDGEMPGLPALCDAGQVLRRRGKTGRRDGPGGANPPGPVSKPRGLVR